MSCYQKVQIQHRPKKGHSQIHLVSCHTQVTFIICRSAYIYYFIHVDPTISTTKRYNIEDYEGSRTPHTQFDISQLHVPSLYHFIISVYISFGTQYTRVKQLKARWKLTFVIVKTTSDKYSNKRYVLYIISIFEYMILIRLIL